MPYATHTAGMKGFKGSTFYIHTGLYPVSIAVTVNLLTDMFCPNQWRADRKQEIARVQGCSEE